MKRAPAYLAPQRRIPRYPSAPATGPVEPGAEIPVHFMNAQLFIACRKPGGAMRLKTSVLGNVTCPKCLKLMNLPAHPKQPSCGAPAGGATPSAESAQCLSAKKPSFIMQCSSFGGSPASASAGAGFFMMGDE